MSTSIRYWLGATTLYAFCASITMKVYAYEPCSLRAISCRTPDGSHQKEIASADLRNSAHQLNLDMNAAVWMLVRPAGKYPSATKDATPHSTFGVKLKPGSDWLHGLGLPVLTIWKRTCEISRYKAKVRLCRPECTRVDIALDRLRDHGGKQPGHNWHLLARFQLGTWRAARKSKAAEYSDTSQSPARSTTIILRQLHHSIDV